MDLLRIIESDENLPALAGAALLDVLEERIVFGVAVADHLDVDLFLVTNVEDNVTVLLVLFDFLVRGFADVRNGHTGSLSAWKMGYIS